jgi:hypothetical protein
MQNGSDPRPHQGEVRAKLMELKGGKERRFKRRGKG